MSGSMPLHYLCAKFCQSLRDRVVIEVRTADGKIEIEQHFGNSTHARAADANEVHVFDFMLHHALSCLQTSPDRRPSPCVAVRISQPSRCPAPFANSPCICRQNVHV